MRPVRLAASVLAALLAVAAGGVPALAAAPEYYLAVGDSLSVGAQPGKGPTDEGYTDDLYAALRKKHPDLKLVKLGCGGETTTTMLKGGICTYPEGSQVGAAEAFLKKHAGAVRYVTLNIGANNTGCMLDGDIACGLTGMAALVAELPQIASRLRAAGGDGPAYAAMTYYDPGLAAWVTGGAGQAVAVASVPVVDIFNTWEQAVYLLNGYKVADVNAAFSTHDFTTKATVAPYGTIPLNVARICTWTYQCTDGDGHATPPGYQRIADTFEHVLS
ncbi:SGNH/GDSL hydrolase family protein [Actinomadura rayongensis]|uniref:SGNH/GDSL hydrolase family protein n=1 Tax=Actinomadura rayongensis TaxID=1429076 RepID=A0A6I4WKP2_9ACTN|nr:SGNH/GDSL hydrolase family protein [Actinomadura rayongensis]MXQ68286.1 SGNH/GDSL hydrolase family protein [Actinomadura rayongensis]